jgi:hypothetical protein
MTGVFIMQKRPFSGGMPKGDDEMARYVQNTTKFTICEYVFYIKYVLNAKRGERHGTV